MGFCFDFNFKCCSCNRETDLFKSTNLNIADTKINDDPNGEEIINENGKPKMKNSNGYTIENFKGSVFQCPRQDNNNNDENGNNLIEGQPIFNINILN